MNGYLVTVDKVLRRLGAEDVAGLLRDAYHRLPDAGLAAAELR